MPGADSPFGTVHEYVLYVPEPPLGDAVTAVVDPEPPVGLLTVTVGKELTATVPLAEDDVHPKLSVTVTEYVPVVLGLNEATFPGAGSPVGTVQT